MATVKRKHSHCDSNDSGLEIGPDINEDESDGEMGSDIGHEALIRRTGHGGSGHWYPAGPSTLPGMFGKQTQEISASDLDFRPSLHTLWPVRVQRHLRAIS